MVCCRNGLIYFEPNLQRRIFEILNYALRHGGVLFLGKSEAIIGDVYTFLKIPAGLDSFKPQGLLPQPATIEFQLFVKKASKLRDLQVSRAFKTNSVDAKNDLFQIKVSAYESREATSVLSPVLFLVTFDRDNSSQQVKPGPLVIDGKLALRSVELEQEHSSTNEELQSSNEKLETANEEFQSTNEELMTALGNV